jgi:putative sigma-54 modulation protein
MVNKEKFAEEEALGYNISIIGRHIQVTDAMKQYAWDKLSKIERFHNHIMDVHVTMDIQKLEHSVVIIVKFDHFKIKAQAVTTDMYVSIDQAIDRLQKQFRRWKDKIQDHSKKKLSVIDMKVNVLQRPYNEIDEYNSTIETEIKEKRSRENLPGKVIGEEQLPMKQLTTDEAIMKMELSGDHFLIYRCEEDRKIKVIYRRNDGNYGIIQPE